MPKCDCHDLEMRWQKDSRKRPGGYWRCKKKMSANSMRYRKTKNGKKTWERYASSDHYKKMERVWSKNYEDSTKGYMTRRKRRLRIARQKILIQLEELQNVRSASDS